MLVLVLFILFILLSICLVLLLLCWRVGWRWCSKGSIWQLVLREVLTHLVQSVYGPKSEFRDLDPSVIHSLGVHNNDNQVKAVLLKRSSKAGTSSWSDSCLDSVEALSQELVGVGPGVLSGLVLEVTALARVVLLDDDLTDEGVLHDDAC